MAKIVVITGSPRNDGNSFALTDAFIEAAIHNQNNIVRFDTAFSNLSGCRACKQCFQHGRACVFDDDFNSIAEAILDSDAVVFSLPVYWYSFPAQIKCVIDKLYAFLVGGKRISGKKCALIACSEEQDVPAFDPIRIAYEKSIKVLNWESVGEIYVPGVYSVGDIKRTDGCYRASQLADRFKVG